MGNLIIGIVLGFAVLLQILTVKAYVVHPGRLIDRNEQPRFFWTGMIWEAAIATFMIVSGWRQLH
jgi:hypothetical protein